METKQITNKHNPKQAAKYNLGDIVVLKSFAANCTKVGDGFYFKDTAPINVLPFMVVVRADLNQKAKMTDKHLDKTFVRYRCMWYDPRKGEFQEEVFFEGVLVRVHAYENIVKNKVSLFEYGDVVHFGTRSFEMNKFFADNQYYNHFRDVTNFMPPDLTIVDFKTAKDIGSDRKHSQDIITEKENGEVIRYDREDRVVCQWYSTAQGKFVKYDFIPEALRIVKNMPNFEEV